MISNYFTSCHTSKYEIEKRFPKEGFIKKLLSSHSDSENMEKFTETRNRITKFFTESQIIQCIVEDKWPNRFYKYISIKELKKLPVGSLKKKQINALLFAKPGQEFFTKARLEAIPTDSILTLMNSNKLQKKYYKCISPKLHLANLKIIWLREKPMKFLFPMKSKKEFCLSKQRFSNLCPKAIKEAVEGNVLDKKYYSLLSDKQLETIFQLKANDMLKKMSLLLYSNQLKEEVYPLIPDCQFTQLKISNLSQQQRNLLFPTNKNALEKSLRRFHLIAAEEVHALLYSNALNEDHYQLIFTDQVTELDLSQLTARQLQLLFPITKKEMSSLENCTDRVTKPIPAPRKCQKLG